MQNINYYIGDVVSDPAGHLFLVAGIFTLNPEKRPISYGYYLLYVSNNGWLAFHLRIEDEESMLSNYTKMAEFNQLYSLSDDYLCHDNRCGINRLCELCDYRSCYHNNTILVGDTVYKKQTKQKYIIDLISTSIPDPEFNLTPRLLLSFSKPLDSWTLNQDLIQNIVRSVVLLDTEVGQKIKSSEYELLSFIRGMFTNITYCGVRQNTASIPKDHIVLGTSEGLNRISRGGLSILDEAQISYICDSCIYKNCEECETNNIKKMLWKKPKMS